MPKPPAFQFYPGDWLRDPVSGCSLAAQGLWLRLMILMHDSDRYGYLCQNGLPIPSGQLARRCGSTPDEFSALLAELESAGVPSRSQDGIIFSRRMVRDAEARSKNAERQRRHYHARPNTQPHAPPNGDLTATSREPHNASSSSSSPSPSEKGGNARARAKPPPEDVLDLLLAVEQITGAQRSAGWQMADKITTQALQLRELGFSASEAIAIAGNSGRKYRLGFLAEDLATDRKATEPKARPEIVH